MSDIPAALDAEIKRSVTLYIAVSASICFCTLMLAIVIAMWAPSRAEPKTVYIKVPWADIYTACQGDWSVENGKRDGTEIRTERIKICGQIANDAARLGFAN